MDLRPPPPRICMHHKLRDLSAHPQYAARNKGGSRLPWSLVLRIPLNKNLSDLVYKSFLNPEDQRDFVPCPQMVCTSQIVNSLHVDVDLVQQIDFGYQKMLIEERFLNINNAA